jgi:glyoxalase family protein
MPTTMGFHHVTMVSGNAARTVDFYRVALGLELLKQVSGTEDPSAYNLHFGIDGGRPGTLLTFFDWSGMPKGHPGIGGVHHVAMGVPDEPALLKWKRRLNDLRIATSGPIDRGYFKSLYFNDPDGQILELATAGPGYAIDEPADALGQQETLPDPNQLQRSPKARAYALSIHPEPVPVVTPDMAITGIHHISAITSDVVRANAFYQRTLGLKLIKKSVNQDDPSMPHHFWARYENGRVEPHSSWTMFGFPPGWHEARSGTGQTHRVAFRAKDAKEQLAWREALLAEGVEVSPVVDRGYFSSIYFEDPDGLLLEIATDGPGMRTQGDSRLVTATTT